MNSIVKFNGALCDTAGETDCDEIHLGLIETNKTNLENCNNKMTETPDLGDFDNFFQLDNM